MPEIAEVRLTKDFLSSKLDNQIITNWIFTSGQYEDDYPVGYKELYNSLPLIVKEVGCKGKTIYFILFNEYKIFYVVNSLRMTGRWQSFEDEYCRWNISLDNGEKVWFRNQRCLETLSFTSNKVQFDDIINKLGPDILSEEFTLDVWRNIVKKHKNKNITLFLMNQNILSGIGNYLKSEILYYAKIDPRRKIGNLNNNECEKLYEGIRIIPRIAYNAGGLSIHDYTDANGKNGFYEFKLKVYGKNWAEQLKTSEDILTYWSPSIQI